MTPSVKYITFMQHLTIVLPQKSVQQKQRVASIDAKLLIKIQKPTVPIIYLSGVFISPALAGTPPSLTSCPCYHILVQNVKLVLYSDLYAFHV